MRRLFYDQLHIIHPRILLLLFLLLVTSNIIMISIFGGLTGLAMRHFVHSLVGLIILIGLANTSPRFWFKHAFTIYGVIFFMLILVELFGAIGLGAQRWLDIGGFRFQPSEMMKIGIVLALARYFQALNPKDYYSLRIYIIPILLVAVPFVLVMVQPDLGTAMLLLLVAVLVIFAAGLPNKFIYIGVGTGLASAVYLWLRVLRDYQKNRVFAFLDPTSDPAGSGYHINQSIIAIGSGGFFGKGFGGGSQAQLDFLPEKHTDFIFTAFAEQFGFLGSIIVLGIEFSIVYLGFSYSREIVPNFAKLLGFGVIGLYAVQVSINSAMVLGLIPVVGVPLPIFSYGGTSMLTNLAAFGIFFAAMKGRHETSLKY
ncbi:MAG: rod shape-determining protein RodA [Hydrotalea sp.]|nr:rod shape-determining protein RodA [Hydrotalea sp.]